MHFDTGCGVYGDGDHDDEVCREPVNGGACMLKMVAMMVMMVLVVVAMRMKMTLAIVMVPDVMVVVMVRVMMLLMNNDGRQVADKRQTTFVNNRRTACPVCCTARYGDIRN